MLKNALPHGTNTRRASANAFGMSMYGRATPESCKPDCHRYFVSWTFTPVGFAKRSALNGTRSSHNR